MEDEALGTAVTRIDTPRRRDRSSAAPAETSSSRRLGHFQLLERIGSGGMGTVYSAYDLDLDRKVAIKVLVAEDEDSEHATERKQRLLREAQAMAKLSHPNVVPVYEVGVDSDTVFIAMEYVAGKPLDEWLLGKPSSRSIVDVFVQAGRGLAAAHEAGIVHRDFKPANVMVDDRNHARVTDFGIARFENDDHAEPTTTARGSIGADLGSDSSTPLTRRGALVGTPAYMSPEQFAAATADARSDQFSFCVALYEALFGKRPFAGRNLELLENVKHGRVEKPDPKAGIPAWLIAIVMRGLSVDPAGRFPSMAELVAGLADPPGHRRRAVVAGVAAALAIGAIGAIAGSAVARENGASCDATARFDGIWDDEVAAAVDRAFAATRVPYASTSSMRVRHVLDRYRASWLALHAQLCESRGHQSDRIVELQNGCLAHRLDEVRALAALLTATVDAKTVEKAVEAASSLPPVSACGDTAALLQPDAEPTDPDHRARRAELDRLSAMRRLGHFKDAVGPSRALVANARTAGDTSLLGEALELQGFLEYRTGDLKAAEQTLGFALREARRTRGADRFVSATLALIEVLRDGGITKAREAIGVGRVAQAVVDDANDPALPIRLLVAQSRSLSTAARRNEGLPLLREARTRVERVFGDDHALSIAVTSALAANLSLGGNREEGSPIFDRVIESATRTYGPLHPTTIGIKIERCSSSGEAAAPACFAAVMPDAVRVLGPSDRGTLIGYGYYSIALLSLGRNKQARVVLAEAIKHVPETMWDEKFYVASDIARMLGKLELDDGDFALALEHCRKARDATEVGHRGLDVEVCIGEAQLGLDMTQQALSTLEGAQPQTAKADLGQIGNWRFALARAVWTVRHDVARARALATQARLEVPFVSRPDVDAWLAKLPRS